MLCLLHGEVSYIIPVYPWDDSLDTGQGNKIIYEHPSSATVSVIFFIIQHACAGELNVGGGVQGPAQGKGGANGHCFLYTVLNDVCTPVLS